MRSRIDEEACCKSCEDGDGCDGDKLKRTKLKNKNGKKRKVLESEGSSDKAIYLKKRLFLKNLAKAAHKLGEDADALEAIFKNNPTFSPGRFNATISKVNENVAEVERLAKQFNALVS